MSLIQRRGLLAAGLALPAIGARAQATQMTAAVYPGGWDEALRAVLARYGSAASAGMPAAESPAPLPVATSRRASPSSRRAVTSSPLAPPPR